MAKPKLSKQDEWAIDYARRFHEKNPRGRFIVGSFKGFLFCTAFCAGVGVYAWWKAFRHGELVSTLPIYVLIGAVLGAVGSQLMALFDRYRAARYHAGKAPIEGRSFVKLVIFAAIGIFILFFIGAIVVLGP